MWNGWKITRARFTEFRNASLCPVVIHMQRLLLMFEVSNRSFICCAMGYSQWSMHSEYNVSIGIGTIQLRNSNLLTESNECMSQFVHRLQFIFMDFMSQSAYNLYNNTNYATFNSIIISHLRQGMASGEFNTNTHTNTYEERKKQTHFQFG